MDSRSQFVNVQGASTLFDKVSPFNYLVFDDRIFFVNVNGLRIKPEHLIQPTFMKEIYFRRRAYSMPYYLHFYYALIPKNFQ